jgi:hypothetical protein
MEFYEIRELVRVRHELRRLVAEGRQDEARAALVRLRALADRDPVESTEVAPELTRWGQSLGVF